MNNVLLAKAVTKDAVRGTLAKTGNIGAATQSYTEDTIINVIGRFVQYGMSLLGILLGLYLLWGGWLWMTAGGDSGRVKTAKDTMRNAVIGLFLIIMAFYTVEVMDFIATGNTSSGPGVTQGQTTSGTSAGAKSMSQPYMFNPTK
jgi:hypothetical protein